MGDDVYGVTEGKVWGCGLWGVKPKIQNLKSRTHEVTFLLVCYDIADDGRLRKVAKVMKGFGERVQRSVFECHLDEKQFERMLKKVRAAMDETEDGLRVYRLCKSCQKAREAYGIGEVFDPPDVLIV